MGHTSRRRKVSLEDPRHERVGLELLLHQRVAIATVLAPGPNLISQLCHSELGFLIRLSVLGDGLPLRLLFFDAPQFSYGIGIVKEDYIRLACLRRPLHLFVTTLA